jgi:predicted secreted hydrolase
MRSKYLVTALIFLLLLPGLNYSSAFMPIPVLAPAWREAAPGYQYSFPRDHGAHPDYRVEWWYYTGNLESKNGRRFGYQLTFFRVGVTRGPANASKWALRDLYMSHFAVSDIDRQSFKSFERINRAGIGWAGASTVEQYKPGSEIYSPLPIRVWNEDWSAQIDQSKDAIQASEGSYSIDLQLAAAKPEVIHGENGISQRGPSSANASHYFSISRAVSSGQITVGDERFDVSGLSWIDHEFGTSFLDEQQTGWDWFSIQLEDGRDLMLFQIRRADGSIDPRSSGTLIDSSGMPTHLSFADFSLVPGDIWRSPKSGAAYPVAWRIDLFGYGLRLNVAAALADQELRDNESTSITYWEGSITAEDINDRKIRGRGYLEMTGYTGVSMGSMLR